MEDEFLQLVRLGIGKSKSGTIPKEVDWDAMKALADAQGLLAVILDGIENCHADNPSFAIRPDGLSLIKKLEWIGEVMKEYEGRYDAYENAISSLAGFYNSHGIKMMVLKGYACSLGWPNPKHRPCGDIDIWLFGKQKEADAILSKERGIAIDYSHHHHTVFDWGDFMVENHYDFLIVSASKSNKKIESILKELALVDSNKVEIEGVDVYFPSPNLNALFLLRHMLNHFAGAGVNLRNLLDWAFFWERNGEKVDWKFLSGVLDKYTMMDFFHIVNQICIEDLGFDKTIFPETQSSKSDLKVRVLEEILNPKTNKKDAHNPHLIPRLLFKMRRWRLNSWKRQLCYKEGNITAFISSVWMHLTKPSSI
jgi:hypothetical protein